MNNNISEDNQPDGRRPSRHGEVQNHFMAVKMGFAIRTIWLQTQVQNNLLASWL